MECESRPAPPTTALQQANHASTSYDACPCPGQRVRQSSMHGRACSSTNDAATPRLQWPHQLLSTARQAVHIAQPMPCRTCPSVLTCNRGAPVLPLLVLCTEWHASLRTRAYWHTAHPRWRAAGWTCRSRRAPPPAATARGRCSRAAPPSAACRPPAAPASAPPGAGLHTAHRRQVGGCIKLISLSDEPVQQACSPTDSGAVEVLSWAWVLMHTCAFLGKVNQLDRCRDGCCRSLW